MNLMWVMLFTIVQRTQKCGYVQIALIKIVIAQCVKQLWTQM